LQEFGVKDVHSHVNSSFATLAWKEIENISLCCQQSEDVCILLVHETIHSLLSQIKGAKHNITPKEWIILK